MTFPSPKINTKNDDLLHVEDLIVRFPVRVPLLQRLISRDKLMVHAVDGVSFNLKRGEILGLVGESGCGKTTVGRAIVRLVTPTSGKIILDAKDITKLGQSKIRPIRRKMQMIFQDPHAALNPAMTIGRAIGHPLQIQGIERDSDVIRQRVLYIMEEVGLTPQDQLYDKYPGDLSGGQKQRAVIARAMILQPELLVVDEGVAMLDMSIRAKILELMLELKRTHGLTLIFITHDLATAKFLCDRIAIMYLGRIVEIGPAAEIYANPKHPYTQALLQVIPIPDPDKRRKKILPKGEVPDAINPPAGCRFHPRCNAVLTRCGWEGRDFIEFLEHHLSTNPEHNKRTGILGPIEKWWAKGFVAGRRADPEILTKLADETKRIVALAPPAMANAVQSVSIQGESVVVQFQAPDQLNSTWVAGRRVECLLYQ